MENIIGSNGVATPAAFIPSYMPHIMQNPNVLGIPSQQPAQPQPTLDNVMANFQQSGPNQAAPTPEAVAQLWAAFAAQASNSAAPQPAAPANQQAAATTQPAAAPAPVDPFAGMFDGFKPTLPEPEYFKDTNALATALSSGLPQVNWAEMFASQDAETVNKTINTYMQQMLVNSVRGAFHSARSAYEASAPDAFKQSFDAYRKHKQLQAGTQVQAPTGMDEVAKALATKFIAANPTATPDQVKNVVGTLMGTLSSVLTPKPAPNVANTSTDWAAM